MDTTPDISFWNLPCIDSLNPNNLANGEASRNGRKGFWSEAKKLPTSITTADESGDTAAIGKACITGSILFRSNPGAILSAESHTAEQSTVCRYTLSSSDDQRIKSGSCGIRPAMMSRLLLMPDTRAASSIWASMTE